jgi:hypothetical protein
LDSFCGGKLRHIDHYCLVANPVPFELSPSQADPREVVDDWHIAINSNNVDQVLALFASSATITDGKTVISGMDQIRNWVLHSKRMAGLQLNMFHSGLDGEKLIWFDTAHNGWEGHSRYYILRWEAVIVKGKIQSLIVRSRYMPGFK